MNQPGSIGASGPLKPQKFFVPKPFVPPAITVSEEDGDWWPIVSKAIAGIAFAAALAFPLQAQIYTDETTPRIDEDYAVQKQAQVQSQAATIFRDDEIIARISFEEDFYFVQVQQAQQNVFYGSIDEEWISAGIPGEEDFWPYQAIQASSSLAQVFLDDETVLTPFVPAPPPMGRATREGMSWTAYR